MEVKAREIKFWIGRCDDLELVAEDWINTQEIITLECWREQDGWLYVTPHFDVSVQQIPIIQNQLEQSWWN